MSTTFKSWPEYASVEAFVQFVIDDEGTEFDSDDLNALNYRLERPVREIRRELESYGLKLKVREPERRVRGFSSNDNDRWYGPGSEKTHGGACLNGFE